MFNRILIAISLGASLFLTGCVNNTVLPAAEIEAARFVNDDTPFISLITMINTNSNGGEHSALLINGSQQILYDPAGTFRHSRTLRSEDIIYGMTPGLADYYNSYHARFGYYVKVQKLNISLEMADALIARTQAEGAVPKLTCGRATSDILNDFAPFSHINTTYFPGRVMRLFDQIEGVDVTIVREDDIGQNYRSD
ncbi:MAG: hypothetical protein JKY31_05270 [Rhodobacteraceae bacterium]|nr:hypothetical protein [Paracoccaceae bacterium]